MISKKEGMILCFKFCSVALNASFCLKKRKLRKNKSEVFRVKIPQHKVIKCNTYKNSLFFTIVFLQFSVKFYSVKSKKFLCKISNQTQEESDRILNSFIPSGAKTQKKEKMTYPRCGFGACLKCGQAF